MTNNNEYKLYEVVFRIDHNGEYTTFLTIQVEDKVENVDEAIEKAYEHANDVFGFEPTKLEMQYADELNSYDLDK